MTYPGRIIKEGERDKQLVKAVQAQLAARGLGPFDAQGVFGPKTTAGVKVFQARNVDREGNTRASGTAVRVRFEVHRQSRTNRTFGLRVGLSGGI